MKRRPETLAIHEAKLVGAMSSAVAPPIYLSTTFERDSNYELPDGFLYSRVDNPNRKQLETTLAMLEGGETALAFSSGQAAVMAVFQILKSGDHVLVPDDVYYGTPLLLESLFKDFGLSFAKVNMADLEAVEKAITPATKLLWLETPSNPLLKITDIEAITSLAQKYGILTVADNTWATALLQRPLDLGCDLVMHSSTKYLGGHSDVLGGALICKENNELSNRLRQIQTIGGAVPSPFDCWLLARGIKTLSVRIRQQTANAQVLADFLNTHPEIEKVHYPGLATHPGFAIAKKQMLLPGAMLSVQVKGGKEEAIRLATRLELFRTATSLGGIESFVEHRATYEGEFPTTPQNLLRFSIGLEHVDDLKEDLVRGLLV